MLGSINIIRLNLKAANSNNDVLSGSPRKIPYGIAGVRVRLLLSE